MKPDVLEQLYRQYYQSVLLYAVSLCGRHFLAEDLVADAFVKAYISLPDDAPSFQFWLFRVCKNLWLDYIRSRNRDLGAEPLEQLSTKTTPETLHLASERHRALWRAIDTLSPLDKELVTLHYFSNVPLQEIALLLGKSYPAVRQRMTRLRRTLKQRMEEQGYDF